MHLCAMASHPKFAEHFRVRYDGKDASMFKSKHLQFDVDHELDAAQKKRAFVLDVSSPIPSIVLEQSQATSLEIA